MAKRLKRFIGKIKRFTKEESVFKKRKAKDMPANIYKWLSRALPKLRLSHQLIGFFVIVVLFPLLLLSFSIYSINQKAVKKQVVHFTEQTAEVTYEEIRLEMSWQEKQAKLAGEYWLSMLETKPVTKDRIEKFFKSYSDYQAVAFYDNSGNMQSLFRSSKVKSDKDLNLPFNLEVLPDKIGFNLNYHRKSKKSNTLTYSLQVIVPVSLLSVQTKSNSFIVFAKEFPYMENLIRKRFKTFNDGFVIVDKNGIILAGPPALVSKRISKEDLLLYRSSKEGVVQEFAVTKSFYDISYNSISNTNTYYDEQKLEKVIIKVPDIGWGLIIESPYHVQTQYIARAKMQSVGLVFLCIILIVLLGLMYSRGINRNFRQLIKGIKALAEGRYSRKIRLITKSWTPYEIVYLAAEFNRMATKISTAWTSIQKLNQELVHKNHQDLFIAQATQRLHNSLELDTVCKTSVEILSEPTGITGALLFLKTDSDDLELAAHSLQTLFCHPEEIDLIPKAVLSKAIKLHKQIFLFKTTESWLSDNTIALIQPVFYQDNPLGVVVLTQSISQDLVEPVFNDLMIIEMLSVQIGVAIYQARQWKQLQIANTKLSKLDEMKSNLIDTVSHELRTPLTNIKGYTSRLMRYEGTLDTETRIKSLKVIKQQADRLGRMVEDLLVIPELERGEGIRVFPDRTNLYDLLMRSVTFIQEKANREIKILGCPDELDILVDPDRMEQVILNLLDNAIKYSPEASFIEVQACQVNEDNAQIKVFNQSEPIPPEELSMLFTKFKRLDERLTRTTRGTGLGLFITKGLVEAMGGNIRLEASNGFMVILEVPLFKTMQVKDSKESIMIS